jgi:hypothetical protein
MSEFVGTVTSDRPVLSAPGDGRVRIVEGMATGEETPKCLVGN